LEPQAQSSERAEAIVRPKRPHAVDRPEFTRSELAEQRPDERGRRVFRDVRAKPARRFATLLAAGCLAGVLAGFLELALYLLERDVLHHVSLRNLHDNRNILWMMPLCEAVGVFLLVLSGGLLCRVLPGALARRIESGLLAIGIFLGPVLGIRGLHPLAAAILVLGLAAQPCRWFMNRTPKGERLLSRGGLCALVVLAGYVLIQWNATVNFPQRALAQTAAPPAGTPNLLWIVLDTTRADRLGLYGYKRETSPNLDRWGSRGVVFEQARSAAPWTLPSHLSMFTGLWPFQHRARIDRPYHGKAPTIAEFLAQNGFETAGLVANTGCCNACYGLGRGFGRYVDHESNLDVNLYQIMHSSSLGRWLYWLGRRLGMRLPRERDQRKLAPRMSDLARSWLRTSPGRASNRPFFLFVNFMDAHGPYVPPAGHELCFSREPIPARVLESTPEAGFRIVREAPSTDPSVVADRQARMQAVSRRLSDQYDDCVRYLDGRVGEFLDSLEHDGSLANTWVLITADHGEHFGEHGQFGHGGSLYEELLHVPLILIPPRDLTARDSDTPPRRISRALTLRDLPATVSTLLLPATAHPFPGQSHAGLIRGEVEALPERPILAQNEKQPLLAADAVDSGSIATIDAVYSQNYVYIRSNNDSTIREEIYDRIQDPGQLVNLAERPEEEERLGRMRRELSELLGEGSVRPTVAKPAGSQSNQSGKN
jgi:arylsulfatase A-like enzyme